MSSYSFKSVGKTQEQTTIETLTKAVVPIGIATPLSLGNDTVFTMHTSLIEQVSDNLRNLIKTNWGERVGLYDYGANLRPLLTEFRTLDDFDTSAIERINTAVSRWMPFVSLENYLSELDRTETQKVGVIRLTVSFNVPALQSGRRHIQVKLYVI